METDKVDVIVPVFNEEDGLPEFLERTTGLDLNLQLICIDNASTDKSLALLKEYQEIKVIEHATNEGYGASLRDGMQAATADKIIIIDADCEYPPEAIPALVNALDEFEVVYTSRFLDDRNIAMGSYHARPVNNQSTLAAPLSILLTTTNTCTLVQTYNYNTHKL